MGSPAQSHLPAHEVPSRVATSSDTADPERTDLKTVRRRLRSSFKPSRTRTDDGSDEFLPRNALEEVLTDKTIQLLLMQKPKTRLINVDSITGENKRIKIFAILLLIKKTKRIGPFIEQGVSDGDLPLSQGCLKTCLKKPRLVDSFQLYQGRVNAPMWDFSAQNIQEEKYCLHRKLPFLTKCRLSSGGQGVVWKVKIHPDHYETNIQSVS